MLPHPLNQHQQNISQFARDNHISYLALYGSYARSEQKKNSDLDLLVSFDQKKGLLDLVHIQQELSDLLGVKVDLITKQGLSKYIKPYIQDDLKVIYEKKS